MNITDSAMIVIDPPAPPEACRQVVRRPVPAGRRPAPGGVSWRAGPNGEREAAFRVQRTGRLLRQARLAVPSARACSNRSDASQVGHDAARKNPMRVNQQAGRAAAWPHLRQNPMHVWTAPWMQEQSARSRTRRFDCDHVSGLLARHAGRWPRWVPRSRRKHQSGLHSRCMRRVPWIVGSTDRHLVQLFHPGKRGFRQPAAPAAAPSRAFS